MAVGALAGFAATDVDRPDSDLKSKDTEGAIHQFHHRRPPARSGAGRTTDSAGTKFILGSSKAPTFRSNDRFFFGSVIQSLGGQVILGITC